VPTPTVTVARVMRNLAEALASIGQQPSSDRVARLRAQALLDHAADMPVALLVANNSGHYVDVNALATELTGYSRAELLRMSVWDLTPDGSAAAGRAMWRKFIAAGQMTGKYPLCRKDGTKVRADFRAWANVLPGLHVSALATPALIRRSRAKSGRASRRGAARRD
jgi:PAS domain S-box-containing protein